MALFFADTAYLAAIINERDNLHGVAVTRLRVLARDPDVHLVTSTLVLSELLAMVSRMGLHVRRVAAQYVKRLRGEPAVTIR